MIKQSPCAAELNYLIVDGNWQVSFFAKNPKKFLRHGSDGSALVINTKRFYFHLFQFRNIEHL